MHSGLFFLSDTDLNKSVFFVNLCCNAGQRSVRFHGRKCLHLMNPASSQRRLWAPAGVWTTNYQPDTSSSIILSHSHQNSIKPNQFTRTNVHSNLHSSTNENPHTVHDWMKLGSERWNLRWQHHYRTAGWPVSHPVSNTSNKWHLCN